MLERETFFTDLLPADKIEPILESSISKSVITSTPLNAANLLSSNTNLNEHRMMYVIVQINN
jgi:hypothetical protein